MFRGSFDELDSAFAAASSSLRPLSPGSVPPPRQLPPPPVAALHSAGDLVIDQPSFLRQNWPRQQKMTSTDADDTAKPAHPPPKAPIPFAPAAPIAEPRVLDVCPPQPLPPPDAMLPTFRVKPFSREAKHWTPYNQVPVPATPQPPPPPPASSSATPAKWQPSETPVVVRSQVEVNLDPEPEPPLPPDSTMTTWLTPPTGRVSLRLEQVDGPQNNVEVVPRWALPLRSAYDWREAYYWAEGDDWELTEDGQYCIRKSKNHRSVFDFIYN